MSSLRDDEYEFYEDSYELVGRFKNRHFKLGQEVTVVVSDIDRIAQTVDFELVEDVEEYEQGER